MSQLTGSGTSSIVHGVPDLDNCEFNDAKKLKLDMQRTVQPTKVVHIRNAPEDIAAIDLCVLSLKFGTVVNTLIMRQKGQAFIEFSDEESAVLFVNYHNYVPAIVRNKHIFIQLSTHTHLKTNAESQNATQAAINALAVYPGSQSFGMPPSIPAIASAAALTNVQVVPTEGCIIHLVVERAIYSITLDTLYQIFSRFGPVTKIVTFNKNSEFQGFVQYLDPLSAMAALHHLDNQNIYSSCCTLRLSETKMKDLDVKANSDKARDYVKDPPQFVRNPHRIEASMAGMGAMPGMGMGLNPFNPLNTLNSLQFTQQGGLPSLGGLGGGIGLPSPHFPYPPPPPDLSAVFATGIPQPPQIGYSISSVLLVSNLAEAIASPDALFILFGVYGDVRRVKILYKKPDTALIQMQDPISAQQALLSLNGVVCGDKKIYVSYSIYMEVQMPKPTDEAQDLTKDFSDSPLHRFRKPNPKIRDNVYGPSPCLHLSNIQLMLQRKS